MFAEGHPHFNGKTRWIFALFPFQATQCSCSGSSTTDDEAGVNAFGSWRVCRYFLSPVSPSMEPSVSTSMGTMRGSLSTPIRHRTLGKA